MPTFFLPLFALDALGVFFLRYLVQAERLAHPVDSDNEEEEPDEPRNPPASCELPV